MLKLQRHFGALLRQAAFLEGVGKLIGLADAHQELRLRAEFLRVHAVPFGDGRKGGEVYIGGDVLFTGSIVGTGADRVLPKSLHCAAMAARKLFFSGVAVVNGDDESASQTVRDALHKLLRDERYFHALSGLRMD